MRYLSAILLIPFAFTVASCGQTGPLYLPTTADTTAPVTTDASHGPLQSS